MAVDTADGSGVIRPRNPDALGQSRGVRSVCEWEVIGSDDPLSNEFT